VVAPPAAPVPSPAIRTATPGTGVALPRRTRGEDLIAELFEAMHDLHFVRDSVEGGDFCLALAMEKLPSQAGMVHLYDINSREFLVSSVRGPSMGKLLMRRHPETDELLSSAMRKRGAVVLDKATAETQAIERYTAIGGMRSMMIAPVMQSGRFLGAIELVNPLDGQPFTEAEGNALAYIAEQFAEFVATRGIVIDPERISARNLPGS
jgi:GAF domain-containing protein